MDLDLKNFLKSYPKKEKNTHTLIPGSSYTIPDEKLDEFYKIYQRI